MFYCNADRHAGTQRHKTVQSTPGFGDIPSGIKVLYASTLGLFIAGRQPEKHLISVVVHEQL